jgi:hypothetical protein|tara:strand:- start:1863 stop:2372 length:510 start_codon:yes stop_codon:yes gene_type:complete
MTIRSIWRVLIKLSGLSLLINLFEVIPATAIGVFTYPGFETIGLLLLVLTFYICFIRFILFKSDWIIVKLRLDQDFSDERIEINLEKSIIYTIAILIIGGVIFINAFANLVCEIMVYINNNRFIESGYYDNSNLSANVIFYSVKTVIGYLLIRNVRKIIVYIDSNKKME